MSRRTFTTEFKRQAVLLVLNQGIPVQTVAIKLGIHTNTLYRWISQYESSGSFKEVYRTAEKQELIRQLNHPLHVYNQHN